jgi:hypothetical protein
MKNKKDKLKLTIVEKIMIVSVVETVVDNLHKEQGRGFCSDTDLIFCIREDDLSIIKRALKKLDSSWGI